MTSYNLRPLGALSVAELRRPDTGLNRTDLDVLRALVTFWNCRSIRPSQTLLAERAGVSKRTVVEAVRHLKEAGAVRTATGAAGGACYYSLNLSAVLTETGFNLADIPGGWYAGYKPAPAAADLDAPPDSRPLTPVPSRVSEDIIAAQSAKRIAKQRAEAEEEAAEKARLAEFNAAYPRGAALPNQWADARRHAEAEVLIRAARAYAAQCKRRNTQERYITLARNWLRNHAWEDYKEQDLRPSEIRNMPYEVWGIADKAGAKAAEEWDAANPGQLLTAGDERFRHILDARVAAATKWANDNGYDLTRHLS